MSEPQGSSPEHSKEIDRVPAAKAKRSLGLDGLPQNPRSSKTPVSLGQKHAHVRCSRTFRILHQDFLMLGTRTGSQAGSLSSLLRRAIVLANKFERADLGSELLGFAAALEQVLGCQPHAEARLQPRHTRFLHHCCKGGEATSKNLQQARRRASQASPSGPAASGLAAVCAMLSQPQGDASCGTSWQSRHTVLLAGTSKR